MAMQGIGGRKQLLIKSVDYTIAIIRMHGILVGAINFEHCYSCYKILHCEREP